MISMSPDSSVHYEEVEKELPSDGEGQSDYIDENYEMRKVRHSESDQEEEEDYGEGEQEEEEEQDNKEGQKIEVGE